MNRKLPFQETIKSRNLHPHPVEIGANHGADEEDGELKDAKDEAVLGGHAALLLGLVRVEGRLHGDGHGVAEVDHDEGERDEPLLAAEVHAEHCCGVENRLFASRVSRFLALRLQPICSTSSLYLCVAFERLILSSVLRARTAAAHYPNWKSEGHESKLGLGSTSLLPSANSPRHLKMTRLQLQTLYRDRVFLVQMKIFNIF